MRAVLCTHFGPPNELELADIPAPKAAAGEAVVRVKAAALNFFDTLIIAGKYQHKPPFPFSPASEFAGIVESVGTGVTDIAVGDRVVGLHSTGLHSNGYSLARKIAFDHAKLAVDAVVPEIGGTVGEVLLTPTRIYVKALRNVLRNYPVKRMGVVHGLAHITGEGLEGNIPRILPAGKRVALVRAVQTLRVDGAAAQRFLTDPTGFADTYPLGADEREALIAGDFDALRDRFDIHALLTAGALAQLRIQRGSGG